MFRPEVESRENLQVLSSEKSKEARKMVEKYADDSSDNGKSPRDELNEFVNL